MLSICSYIDRIVRCKWVNVWIPYFTAFNSKTLIWCFFSRKVQGSPIFWPSQYVPCPSIFWPSNTPPILLKMHLWLKLVEVELPLKPFLSSNGDFSPTNSVLISPLLILLMTRSPFSGLIPWFADVTLHNIKDVAAELQLVLMLIEQKTEINGNQINSWYYGNQWLPQ